MRDKILKAIAGKCITDQAAFEAVDLVMEIVEEEENKELKQANRRSNKIYNLLFERMQRTVEKLESQNKELIAGAQIRTSENTYLESQNKEAKEHWDIAVNDVNRLEGEVKELRELALNCVELNMCNYSEDQVKELNDTMIHMFNILNY